MYIDALVWSSDIQSSVIAVANTYAHTVCAHLSLTDYASMELLPGIVLDGFTYQERVPRFYMFGLRPFPSSHFL